MPTLINQDNTKLLQLQAEYNNVSGNLDKGKTQELLNAIYSNMSPGNLKNKLVSSGMLSDTVLISAIMRTNPLPPGHLKDIVIPNSPVSDNVMAYLDYQMPQIPEGIATQIKNAQIDYQINRTPAAIKRDIDATAIEKQMYINNLLDYYVANNIKDSVKYLLGLENTDQAQQLLISDDIADSNYTSALNRLNQYNPATTEEQEWKQITQLNISLAMQNKTWFDMTPAQVTFIRTLANQNPPSLAATNAQAVLRLVFDEEFNNPLPATAYSTGNAGITKKQDAIDTTEFYLGDNIPNPFDNTTEIPYRLPEGTANAKLVVTDVSGKTLESFTLSDKNNSIKINMTKYRSGVYFYKLIANDAGLNTKRMILIKK